MDKDEIRAKIRDTIMSLVADDTDQADTARQAFHDVLQAKMRDQLASSRDESSTEAE